MVIPCYRVKAHILRVIDKSPAWVEWDVCVDDACPEGSGDFIAAEATDSACRGGAAGKNQGVGGAMLAGYAEAARRGGQDPGQVDGDDQMEPSGYMGQLVAPILLGEADYAKGNRFTSSAPAGHADVRVLGNAG